MRLLLGAGALALSACAAHVQTTSGRDYLARAEPALTDAAAPGALDADVFRRAAAVEPLLRFPARLGVARIEGGVLTPIPDEEMEAFARFAEQAGGAYGEMVPLNLLVTAMSVPEDRLDAVTGAPSMRIDGNHHTGLYAETAQGGLARARTAVEAIRYGAARQHMDAVLVYEVFGTSDSKQSPLSVGNLTILGAFLLPGSKVDAVGHAEAILLDVRNGYPYLTASETVTREGLAASARAWQRREGLKAAAEAQAVADLADSLTPAFARLAVELGNLPDPASPGTAVVSN